MTMSIQDLTEHIRREAKHYYEGNQRISDPEFDALVEQLRDLDPMNPVLLVPGWGYKPGRRKVTHQHGLRIGSLDEPKGLAALDRFFSLTNWMNHVAMPKLDGMTVVLYYDEKGRFERAVTRGDGTEGMDISSKILKFGNPTPAKVPSYGKPFAIRGEAVMPRAAFFARYADESEKASEDATRSRNVVAGMLNRDEDSDDLSNIHFVAFDVLTGLSEDMSKMVAFLWLGAKGFEVVDYLYLTDGITSDAVDEARARFVEGYRYPTDGVVFTTDAGYRTEDEKICAYKFPGATARGKVKRVDWRLCPTGKFSPTIEFETPVQLTGAKFSRATAHNFVFCEGNGIGPGAVVEFTRSGDVIPKVVSVVEQALRLDHPSRCPVCDHETEIDGKDLICPNSRCPGQSLERLHLFVSLAAPVDGLARKTWDEFFEANRLKSITDFYVAAASGSLVLVGGDSTQALLKEAMCALQTVNVTTLLKALVTGVGDIAAPALASILRLEEVVLGAVRSYNLHVEGTLEDAKKVARVTEPAYNRMAEASLFLQEVMTCIALAGGKVVLDGPKAQGDGPVIVMTGKLSADRKLLKAEFESRGCVVLDAVKKGVDYLITDDPSPTSSKGKKATQLGVAIVTEADFRRILDERSPA